MADEVQIQIVVLWQNEVKIAAQAVYEAMTVLEDPKATDADLNRVVKNALQAAAVALQNAHRDDAILLLCNADRGKFVPRDYRIERASRPTPMEPHP